MIEAPDRQYLAAVPVQWKDREGHVWNITDMADEHIANSMHMMLRNAEGIYERDMVDVLAFAETMTAEQASIDTDNAIANFAALSPTEWVRRYHPAFRTMWRVRQDRRRQVYERMHPDIWRYLNEEDESEEAVLAEMLGSVLAHEGIEPPKDVLDRMATDLYIRQSMMIDRG